MLRQSKVCMTLTFIWKFSCMHPCDVETIKPEHYKVSLHELRPQLTLLYSSFSLCRCRRALTNVFVDGMVSHLVLVMRKSASWDRHMRNNTYIEYVANAVIAIVAPTTTLPQHGV